MADDFDSQIARMLTNGRPRRDDGELRLAPLEPAKPPRPPMESEGAKQTAILEDMRRRMILAENQRIAREKAQAQRALQDAIFQMIFGLISLGIGIWLLSLVW